MRIIERNSAVSMKSLNIQNKKEKFEDKTQENTKLDQNFLSRRWKVLMIKEKMDKLDYIYYIYNIYKYQATGMLIH